MITVIAGLVLFVGGLLCGMVARDMLGHANTVGIDEQRSRQEKLEEAERIIAHHEHRVALAELRKQVHPNVGPVPRQVGRGPTEFEPGPGELDDNP